MIEQRGVADHRQRADHRDISPVVPRANGPAPKPRTAFDRAAFVRLARFVAIRFAVMALSLMAIGAVLTYASPLRGVRSWDASNSESLASSRTGDSIDLAVFVSRRGDTLPIVVFGAVVALGAAARRHWRAAVFVPLALLIEVTTFAAVNFAVQRPRPPVETVGAVPSTFSFPSGHVAATLVCWFGLSWLLLLHSFRLATRVAAGVGVIAVGAMGWARVYLGMHHLLDVVFGVVMGAGALAIATGALQLTRGAGAGAPRH